MTEPTITVTLTREKIERLASLCEYDIWHTDAGPKISAASSPVRDALADELRAALDSPQPECCDGSGKIEERSQNGRWWRDCSGCPACQPERYTREQIAERLTSDEAIRVLYLHFGIAYPPVSEPTGQTAMRLRRAVKEACADAFPDQQPVEDCERCKGSGVELRQGNGEWISDPCPDCGGSGHDAIPGPTGEPISQGSGLVPEEGVCSECDHDIRPRSSHARSCSRHPINQPHSHNQPEQEGEAGDWPELRIVRSKSVPRRQKQPDYHGENREHIGYLDTDHEVHPKHIALPSYLEERRYVPAPAQHPTGLSDRGTE